MSSGLHSRVDRLRRRGAPDRSDRHRWGVDPDVIRAQVLAQIEELPASGQGQGQGDAEETMQSRDNRERGLTNGS